MAIIAKDGYIDLVRDRVENFHGNQLVYVGWDDHLLFSAAQAFPLPPEMPFQALVSEAMASVFNDHPDFKEIDWASAEWVLDGKPFSPVMEASLKENGVGHKSLIRFKTPGLKGINGLRL
ncbi:MAG: phenol hydroxylase subunit P4 [Cycloclasticus sp.]